MPGWKSSADLGKDWPKIRRRQLTKEPRCQFAVDGRQCPEPADDADHIIPRFEGGTDDESNLQSLCRAHHLLKTSAEGQRAWAKKKDAINAAFDYTEPSPLDLLISKEHPTDD